MIDGTRLMELVRAGGPLMVFMIAASVVVLSVALERAWVIWSFRRNLRWLEDQFLPATRRGDLVEARRLAAQAAPSLREIFLGGLDRATGAAAGDPARAMLRAQKRAIGDLRSSVWVLGTAGALMPFVGLLGTVLGVMASFRQIGETGESGFAVVSAGISEALIATAAGLGVALEAVLFYNYALQNIATVGRDLALLVDEVHEHLQAAGGRDAGNQPK